MGARGSGRDATAASFAPEAAPKVIVNAALTGVVPTREQSAHVPITEDEIVADALACRAAGAAIVHLHVRDEAGRPDCRADRYARVIARIRERSDLLVCVSTSGRVHPALEQRAAVLDLEGDLRPDLASLTAGSLNFPDGPSVSAPADIRRLAETMLARGIKPELEIFDAGMLNFVRYLDRKLGLPRPLYLNCILGALGGMPGRPRDLAYLLDDLPAGCVWSAGGVGAFQLPVCVAALAAGGHVRVGLEDFLYYDAARTRPATNPGLVARVARVAAELGREPATPAEARALLGLGA